jgi:hypothetical protein
MKQHANHLRIIRTALLAGIITTLASAPAICGPVIAHDTVTVATVNGAQFTQVDVPVFIRDTSGTPLGLDQPAGSRIQSYAIKVTYAPASAVQSITFTRAGITAALTPTFESSPTSAGAISLLDTFQESTNLIPFTLDAAAPGNQVAHLLVTLSPSATPGTVITLTVDPTLTQLSNEGGTTSETPANGSLALVSGAITVVPSVPAVSHLGILLLALTLAILGVRIIRL